PCLLARLRGRCCARRLRLCRQLVLRSVRNRLRPPYAEAARRLATQRDQCTIHHQHRIPEQRAPHRTQPAPRRQPQLQQRLHLVRRQIDPHELHHLAQRNLPESQVGHPRTRHTRAKHLPAPPCGTDPVDHRPREDENHSQLRLASFIL